MGNKQLTNQAHKVHSKQNSLWNRQASLGNCDLVRDNSGKLGELYRVQSIDEQKDMQIYRFRYDHPEHIVTVYYVEKQTQKLLCAVNNRFKVITERTPYRLTDIGNIGYAEGLYIMESILKGAKIMTQQYFSKIFDSNQVYSVQYQENMICFTDRGTSKLWVNEEISINSPKMSLKKNRNQENVVQQLMTLIESKMSGIKFINYMKQKVLAQKQGYFNSFTRAMDFIQSMRRKEQKQTGKYINSVILPNMIMNLERKQVFTKSNVQQKTQNPYDPQLFNKIQMSRSTNDFSTLQKPPRPPRKSSRSSRSSSVKSDKAMTPTKKPSLITLQNNQPASTYGEPKYIENLQNQANNFILKDQKVQPVQNKELIKTKENLNQIQDKKNQNIQKTHPFMDIIDQPEKNTIKHPKIQSRPSTQDSNNIKPEYPGILKCKQKSPAKKVIENKQSNYNGKPSLKRPDGNEKFHYKQKNIGYKPTSPLNNPLYQTPKINFSYNSNNPTQAQQRVSKSPYQKYSLKNKQIRQYSEQINVQNKQQKHISNTTKNISYSSSSTKNLQQQKVRNKVHTPKKVNSPNYENAKVKTESFSPLEPNFLNNQKFNFENKDNYPVYRVPYQAKQQINKPAPVIQFQAARGYVQPKINFTFGNPASQKETKEQMRINQNVQRQLSSFETLKDKGMSQIEQNEGQQK